MASMFGTEGQGTTCTKDTHDQYVRHVHNLFRQSGLKGQFRAEGLSSPGGWLALVQWFSQQQFRWSRSTIRSYRAAITCAVQATIHDEGDREAILRVLATAVAPSELKNPNTASVKRKSVSQREVARILAALDDRSLTDSLLAGFLRFAPSVALRPSEFLDAQVSGNHLRVLNAKATNGRSIGLFRVLDLSQLSGDERGKLKSFLTRFQRARFLYRSAKHFLNCIAARLARVCEKLKIRRLSLYTLRHVGLATAKRHMSGREVAALAGHRSCATATRHYAKRRTGWVTLVVARPTIEAIQAVNDDEYRSSLQLKLGRRGCKYRP